MSFPLDPWEVTFGQQVFQCQNYYCNGIFSLVMFTYISVWQVWGAVKMGMKFIPLRFAHSSILISEPIHTLHFESGCKKYPSLKL